MCGGHITVPTSRKAGVRALRYEEGNTGDQGVRREPGYAGPPLPPRRDGICRDVPEIGVVEAVESIQCRIVFGARMSPGAFCRMMDRAERYGRQVQETASS